ncbi:unnamed protein product [Urochloa humidicola]
MNYPGHDAEDPWCFPAGEQAAATGGNVNASGLADMFPDHFTDDHFELAWEQGGRAGAPGPPPTMQPAESASFWTSPPPPEVRFGPPPEEEMASWLGAIVKGEELAFPGDGREDVVAKGSSYASTTSTDTKEKLPITAGVMGTKHQERKNPPGRGSSRRSHHGEAHNLTEKKRRYKINERLRTLQQLVPGCDKLNQASTLDQTIQYMKSLQHHVQEMCGGRAHPAAAGPIVPPQYAPPVAMPMTPAAPMVLAPAPTTMVPFGAMLHMPHYPAAVSVMVPAAAAPLYPVAAPARGTVAAEDAGSSTRHRQISSSSKGKSSSSRRQKH